MLELVGDFVFAEDVIENNDLLKRGDCFLCILQHLIVFIMREAGRREQHLWLDVLDQLQHLIVGVSIVEQYKSSTKPGGCEEDLVSPSQTSTWFLIDKPYLQILISCSHDNADQITLPNASIFHGLRQLDTSVAQLPERYRTFLDVRYDSGSVWPYFCMVIKELAKGESQWHGSAWAVDDGRPMLLLLLLRRRRHLDSDMKAPTTGRLANTSRAWIKRW